MHIDMVGLILDWGLQSRHEIWHEWGPEHINKGEPWSLCTVVIGPHNEPHMPPHSGYGWCLCSDDWEWCYDEWDPLLWERAAIDLAGGKVIRRW